MSKTKIPEYELVRSSLRSGSATPTGRKKPVVVQRISPLGRVIQSKESWVDALSVTDREPLSAKGGEYIRVQDLEPKHKVATGAKLYKVGILDLGVWMSELPALLKKLNSAQSQFRFYEVQAPVPAGLVKRAVWYTSQGFKLSGKEQKQLERQINANEFYRVGANLREYFRIDYLVAISPFKIAGLAKKELYWNYFSVNEGPVVLASTNELRNFADIAGRPFAAMVGFVIVGQLVCAANPKVQFHADRGCLFDFNEKRVTIAHAALKPHIEPSCMNLIEPRFRDSAAALVRVLAKL